MFDYIRTYHYGRCVKNNDWYLKSFGINRIYYIHRGHISILLDNVRHELKEKHIYLFPQNLKFELILTEDTEVDHTFFDFFSLPAIKMNTLIEIDPAKHPAIDHATRILFYLAETYQTYPTAIRNEYSALTESYLENALFLINKNFHIDLVDDPRINAVLEYIHDNYSKDITLEKLIEITNLEKNYFIRLFKQSMNMTPYQYIKKYRFNVALTLIKQKHSLSETALAVGYSDIAAFSHAFKKIYGITPSEVMNSIRTFHLPD